MARTGAEFERPIRPDQRFVFLLGGLRHDLKLGHMRSAVSVGGAHAIRTGVATANHNHMFAVGAQLAFQTVAGIDFVLLRQKFHGEMHALQFTPRHR